MQSFLSPSSNNLPFLPVSCNFTQFQTKKTPLYTGQCGEFPRVNAGFPYKVIECIREIHKLSVICQKKRIFESSTQTNTGNKTI
jgi:hypothetical protein